MLSGQPGAYPAPHEWARLGSLAEAPSAPIDGPASRRQKGYLAELARQAGEEMPAGLIRHQATAAIIELQERIGRPVPDWARTLPAARRAPESTREPEAAPEPEITSGVGVATDPLDVLAAQAVAAAEAARRQRIEAALGSEPEMEQGPELDLGLSRQRRLDPPGHPDIPPGT